MNVQKAFQDGQEAGFDVLEKLGEIYDGRDQAEMPSVYAGLLTSVMHCMFAHAPSEESADEIIAWARQKAEKHWQDEQAKGENDEL